MSSSVAPARPGLMSRPSSVTTINKTIVLVTGGNTGLGYQMVKSLAEQPNMQVLMGCRDTRKGEAAAATMGAPINVNPIQLDITDDKSIEHCAKTIQQLFGRLDILINNAGTAGLDLQRSGANPTNRENWKHIMDVNVVSTGVITDALIPLLEKSKLPKIIFISSGLGSIGKVADGTWFWDNLPYHASKSAVNMMAAWYATAHPKFKVNATNPGLRATGLNGIEVNEETDPALGAVNVVRLVMEGPNGATGTFTQTEGPLPW